MPEVKFNIENCKKCPYFKVMDSYSTDGWDRMEDWFCKKSNKYIVKFIEWHEENRIEIPEWCEIIIK